MPYGIVNINGKNVPANITYGNNTIGTGTISVFTANNNVIGSSTLFTSQLGNNYIIRNSANVFIGRIGNVISNTAATLTANGNVSMANTNFYFQSFTASEIKYVPNLGTGNITSYSSNNFVYGNSTVFVTEVSPGYQLFDHAGGNLLGVVKSIYSNVKLELTTLPGYIMGNLQFYYYDSNTSSVTNTIFPPNSQNINGALINWSRSGLIPGVTQVKSYHPPIADPTTGILVNFPATVHTNNSLRSKKIKVIENPHLDEITNSQTTYKNSEVKNFNDHNGLIGTSEHKARMGITINTLLSKYYSQLNEIDATAADQTKMMIKKIYGDISLPLPPGIVVDTVPLGFTQLMSVSSVNTPFTAYQGPGANVVYVRNSTISSIQYPTVPDMLASGMNLPPISRIIDNVNDARVYYDNTPSINDLSDAEKSDMTARATNLITADMKVRVSNTGVPASIPGLLNVVLSDVAPSSRQFTKTEYTYAYITPVTSYNKDLPVSSVNLLPRYKTIASPAAPNNNTKGYDSGLIESKDP
jgi:hypothetical protein